MRPGDTQHRVIRVINPATGAVVTGLTLAAFTVTALARGYGAAVWTAWTHGATLTEIGSGDYALAFTAPPTAGWWKFRIVHTAGTYQTDVTAYEGELENQDLDSIYAAGSPYSGSVSTATELGTQIPLDLVAYRWRSIDITLETNGVPVDLTTYGNLRLSVRSKNQTSIKLDASNGSPTGFVLTGSVAGVLHIEFPESTGAGVADIYAALAAGEDETSLYYEVTGDVGSDAAKTVPLIRSSSLRLLRRELGS